SPGDDRNWRLRFQRLAAPGIIVYTLTMTFAVFDWVMSIDPHWTSTIYGMIFITGQVLSAFAFAAAMCTLMSKYEPMAWFFKTDIMHDLGKLMLAFTMFWAYLSFSQFLIIWSAKLPEEITFYTRRINGNVWPVISGAELICGFCIPFALLLSK